MIEPTRLVACLVIVVGLLAVTAKPLVGQERKDLVRQSSIIFEGRVKQVGETTMADVPRSPDMAVVEIERILDKPAAISLQTGALVTVKLKQPGSLRPGDRAVFYTNGRVFGKELAVEEVGHEAMAQQAAAPAAHASAGGPGERSSAESVGQIRQQLSEEALKERMRSAAAVVVGRVREVREPTGAALQPRTDGGLRISEHDPQIAEAVIEVTEGIKGAQAGSEIVVRFPTSEDVMWYAYPKFRVGESGIFILQPDTLTSGAPALLAGAQVPALNASQRGDILPLSDADRVRNLARE